MASRQDRGAHVRAQWDLVRWEDLATFIGPNAGRFEKTWIRSRERVLSKGYANVLSFCWPALFFGFAWFFARKQWAAGALIVILPILLGIPVSRSARRRDDGDQHRHGRLCQESLSPDARGEGG